MQERETPPSERYPPIAAYALIGDCHSAALVSLAGSVDWCCFHRFDARPVFGRILDWDRGGYFRLAPSAPARVSRRYDPGTNVLETTFITSSGRLRLTDCLAMREEADELSPHAPHPYHQLIRVVEGLEGEVEVDLEFHPRFDFGLTTPRLELRGAQTAVVYGGADALVLHSELPLEQTEICGCETRAVVRAGEAAFVSVEYAPPHRLVAGEWSRDLAVSRVEETRVFWRGWAAQSTYRGEYAEAVQRSALVLKALTNAPTGAIVAAPTTSLPEEIGGVRNWDYRYSWLRDSALDVYALYRLGYTAEAEAFVTWLKRTTAGRAEDLQIMYGVGGERLLHEIELDGLEGYRGSAPVRVGNAAYRQFQPDIYGELLDTAWLFHKHGGEIDPVFWDFCRGVIDVVAQRWERPDQGIWEIRDEPRHFTHSKVMSWVAVHRGVKLAETLGLEADLPRWRSLRDAIRARILDEGVDGASGAFTQTFGGDALDASNLLIPLVRFLPADDERVRATMDRTLEELTVDGFVHRYREQDGLPGGEGAFLICSFWLVDNLAIAGRVQQARELFERLLLCANDVGLLSEEVDPSTGELLGNFPQAFSHVGLIGAAINLDEAARDGTD